MTKAHSTSSSPGTCADISPARKAQIAETVRFMRTNAGELTNDEQVLLGLLEEFLPPPPDSDVSF